MSHESLYLIFIGAAQTQWASLTSGHCPTSSVTEDLSPSSISHTPPTSSELMTGTTSANITVGQAKEISPSVTSNFDPVTSAVSMAAGGIFFQFHYSGHISIFSKLPGSAQKDQGRIPNHHHHSSEAVITSSSSSGHAIQLKTTPETFLSGKIISSVSSGVSHMLVTKSKMLTAPTSTDRTFSPSNVSNTSPMTSATSQNHQTLSMKITRGTQTTTVTAVRTSTLSSSTCAHKSTEDTSQRTSSSGTTTTSFPPYVRYTPAVTSKILGTKRSTDSTVRNTIDKSPFVTGSSSPFTSKASTPWQSSVPSTSFSQFFNSTNSGGWFSVLTKAKTQRPQDGPILKVQSLQMFLVRYLLQIKQQHSLLHPSVTATQLSQKNNHRQHQ